MQYHCTERAILLLFFLSISKPAVVQLRAVIYLQMSLECSPIFTLSGLRGRGGVGAHLICHRLELRPVIVSKVI